MITEKFASAVLALIASGTMLALSAGPARAESLAVRAPAADLATAAGRSEIDARVVRAANRVCATDEALPVGDYYAHKACASKAVAKARSQVAQRTTGMQLAAR